MFGNKSIFIQVYHSVSAVRAKEHGSANLGADEQVGDAGCILLQLWHPFLAHILETGGVNHREADEEDVGHGVGQRPEAVVILLKDVTALVNIWRGGGRWSGWQDELRLFNMKNDSHELLRRVRNELPLQADFDSSLRPEELTVHCAAQASPLLCPNDLDEQGRADAYKAAELTGAALLFPPLLRRLPRGLRVGVHPIHPHHPASCEGDRGEIDASVKIRIQPPDPANQYDGHVGNVRSTFRTEDATSPRHVEES